MLVSRQREYLIGSTEKGMQLVRDNKNYAVIGGRETFYYDIKRFGKPHNDSTVRRVLSLFYKKTKFACKKRIAQALNISI